MDGHADGTAFTPRRVKQVALLWCAVWPILLCLYLAGQVKIGWTDGVDRPFGEDFLNFWSAARLAITGQAARIYDIAAFHDYQVGVVGHPIDLYHYSYPPTLPVLTAVFAILPYPIAWLAWQVLGWLAFAGAVRRILPHHWLLVAFAWPAVLINALGGQAGCWTAAIIGWGMILLPRRPVAAGLILSLLAVKPQLCWLVPLALMAGREWRALTMFVIGAIVPAAIATLWFGTAIWPAYAAQATLLKHVILEDGTGTWHRMISIFVLVRHLGAPLWASYGAQAIVSLAVAGATLTAWHRGSAARGHYLIAAMIAGSIYVSDYDCVMIAFPAIYLWSRSNETQRLAVVVAALVPLIASVLAVATHWAAGALLLWPLLVVLHGIDRRDDPTPDDAAHRSGLPA